MTPTGYFFIYSLVAMMPMLIILVFGAKESIATTTQTYLQYLMTLCLFKIVQLLDNQNNKKNDTK
jgi:uncharacterized membrane protein YdjX (TVP38/TMEM64 family)